MNNHSIPYPESLNHSGEPLPSGACEPSPIAILQGSTFVYHEPHPPRESDHVRGDILPWMSAPSRRRMMQSLARIDWAAIPETDVYFGTLTLSPHYWEDPVTVKRALKRFRRRLEYHFRESGYLGAFWRRELGRGGNVHYHLILIGPNGVPLRFLREYFQDCWSDCCDYAGLGDRKTRWLRTSVDFVESSEAIRRYVAKYCAKSAYEKSGEERDIGSGERPADPDACIPLKSLSKVHTGTKIGWGKHWGIWGSSSIPWASALTLAGNDGSVALAKVVKRTARKYLKRARMMAIARGGSLLDPDQDKNRLYHLARGELLRELRVSKRGKVNPETGEVFVHLPYWELMRLHRGGFSLILTQSLLEAIVRNFYHNYYMEKLK